MSNSAKVKRIFNEFNGSNLELIDDLYQKDATFIDPVGQNKGLSAIKNYFEHSYKNVKSIAFEFNEEFPRGNDLVLGWKMTVTAKGLNGGKPVHLDGMSIFKFDEASGKVTYHRDYFDMGEFIYERLPLLGTGLRFIKSKMHGD